MNKTKIIDELRQKHQHYTNYIGAMNEADFMFQYDAKWTAGQQLEHILLSVKPLLALRYPKFILKLALGKSNRPSKSFDDLLQRYKDKLGTGAVATGAFIPAQVPFKQKRAIAEAITKTIDRLIKLLNKYSEQDLDTFIAPHPLLGKLTLRELLYFTIFHVEHHHHSIEEMLQKRK